MTPNSRSYNTHAFTQPDSIIPDLYNPQSLNRYSYALNNPVNNTDPTGHCTKASYSKKVITDDECDALPTSNWGTSVKNVTPTLPADPTANKDDSNPCSFGPYLPTDPCNNTGARPLTGNSDNSTPKFNEWEYLRNIFGQIDPVEIGPLSGSNLSFLQMITNVANGYVAVCGQYCLENPWIIEVAGLGYPVVGTAAVLYDFTYDQRTQTGPYSRIPLDETINSIANAPSKWSLQQKAYVVAVVTIVVVILAPK